MAGMLGQVTSLRTCGTLTVGRSTFARSGYALIISMASLARGGQATLRESVYFVAARSAAFARQLRRAPRNLDASKPPQPRVPLALDRRRDRRDRPTRGRSCSTSPPSSTDTFAYEAGQFCTFRATVDGHEVVRCYSMSSSPDAGEPFKTAVKRVPDGRDVELDERRPRPRRLDRRDAPGRPVRVAPEPEPDRRVRRRQRHHAGDLDRQERAAHHRPRDPARVRQPRRRLRDLWRRARAAPRRLRRAPHRAPAPRRRARVPRCRRVRRARR